MNWIKPAVGVVVGSVATMVIGFGWAGWTSAGTAERLATERAATATTAALVPVCVEKSKLDPASAKKLAELRAMAASWDQRDAVVKDGWATFGATDANQDVAEACAAELVKVAAK
jgi:hypothetical protein